MKEYTPEYEPSELVNLESEIQAIENRLKQTPTLFDYIFSGLALLTSTSFGATDFPIFNSSHISNQMKQQLESELNALKYQRIQLLNSHRRTPAATTVDRRALDGHHAPLKLSSSTDIDHDLDHDSLKGHHTSFVSAK